MSKAMRAGESNAERLERWVTQYGSSILRTCFVYLADKSLAEDAAQDTFLKAWAAMDRFDGSRQHSEKAWLTRIAINTCRDYHRSKWFRHVDLRNALEDLPARYLLAEDTENEHLLLGIIRLPVKLKEVVLMYYYQGMTMQEVAAALRVSPSTVHHRLKKAEQKLRTMLTGGETDE